MLKFSIIVPIYNVEKYLKFCLDSIKKQSLNDYEVLMIDDGSTDNSKLIAKSFTNDQFKYFHKENGGLSSARNYGVKKSKGEYLIFIDSDDYIEKDLLEKINFTIKNYNNPDLIYFYPKLVDENHNLIRKIYYHDDYVVENFESMIKKEYVEPACFYAYKSSFFKNNKFEYPINKYHEDFGLTPLILIKAKNIISIPYYGYNYVQRRGSIMNDPKKNKKRTEDILYHFDNLYKLINCDSEICKDIKDIFNSYIANAVIKRGNILSDKDLKWYINQIKNRKIVSFVLENNIKRKIKKFLMKLNLKFYIRYF